MAIAVALALFLSALGGYKGVLLFTGDNADAEVISYGPRRTDGKGDWYLVYRFKDHTGQLREGQSEFARNARPIEMPEGVRVKYLHAFPAVSGVVGNISATGVSGYLFAIWIFWRGILFVRRGTPSPRNA